MNLTPENKTEETESDLVPVLVDLWLGDGEGEYVEPKPFSIGIEEAQRIIRMKVEQAGFTHCSVYTRYYPANKKFMGFSYETIPETMGHPAVTVEVWDIDSLFPGEVHVGRLK
jgi:hypothetical protein